MRAVPHTQGEPHFIDKPIKGIRAGGGEPRHGVVLLFFEVRLPCFILPQNRHLLGFFPSLGGGEFVRRIPSRTLENLLAVCVLSHASEMQKLDEKVYQDDTNRLVVELLKLCRGQKNVNFENLFELEVNPKVFYTWLVHIVCECDIDRVDELGVKLFYKLQKEKFEGSEIMQNILFNNMLERGERERSLVKVV